MAALVEDNTARQGWTHTHQFVTRGARHVLYRTSLWMSARLPTQLQRLMVSCSTVFLIFVLYCLVKLMLRNQVSGAVAVVLVGALVISVTWLMVCTLCPVGHARGSRVADEQSAVESASEGKKRSDTTMQTALEEVLGSPMRRHRGVAVSPLDGDQKEGEPSGGMGDEQRQEQKEREEEDEKEMGYALSDSERDSASADSDDDDSAMEGEGDDENEVDNDPRATRLVGPGKYNNPYQYQYHDHEGADSDDDREEAPVVDGWAVHV